MARHPFLADDSTETPENQSFGGVCQNKNVTIVVHSLVPFHEAAVVMIENLYQGKVNLPIHESLQSILAII